MTSNFKESTNFMLRKLPNLLAKKILLTTTLNNFEDIAYMDASFEIKCFKLLLCKSTICENNFLSQK